MIVTPGNWIEIRTAIAARKLTGNPYGTDDGEVIVTYGVDVYTFSAETITHLLTLSGDEALPTSLWRALIKCR